MSSGRNAIDDDDDDDLAKLMPNVAKLIRSEESNSFESKGSTSLTFSANTVRHEVESHNSKPSRQRQGESVFREVANKFLRRGAISNRACKSSLLTISSNFRRRVGSPPSERRRNTNALEKENVRPNMPTLAKQGASLVQQQKMEMTDATQRVARKFRKLPSHSEGSNYFSVNSKIQRAGKSDTASGSEHLAQSDAPDPIPKASCNSQRSEHLTDLARKREPGKVKLFRKSMPLNLSALKEEFAEIDGEALEEEEVSIARMPRISPVVASETLLDHGDGILENSVAIQKDLSRNEPEKVASNTAKARIEEAVLPLESHGQSKEGVGICVSHTISCKSPGHDQCVAVSDPEGKGNDAVMSSGHDPNTIPCPMRHLKALYNHDLDDGNQGDSDQCRDDVNPPCIGPQAKSFLKRLNEQVSVGAKGRTADTKSTSCQLEACALDTSGKSASTCVDFGKAHVDGSCDHEIASKEGPWCMCRNIKLSSGCSPTQPNLDKSKAIVEYGPDENVTHRDGSVPHLSSTFRDGQSSPPEAKNPPEQEDVLDIPLQGGNLSERDTSSTPPRLHYSRRRRIIGMNQRRLDFDGDIESNRKAVVRAVDGDSGGVSASTVEFKGMTNSAVANTNHDGHDFDANMTSVTNQEAKLALPDGEVVGEFDDRDCKDQSSKSQAVSHVQGVVHREKLLTSSLAQEGHPPAFEETGEVRTGEVRKDPYCFSCRSPNAGAPSECLKIRGVGKRTWAKLGAPIDGGREWKEGRRVSTRIKSRPLDWWRGERMLYGRVHSTLCTLIGIKTTSPDPVWPRPKPKRGDYTSNHFHVDSFVDGSHCELLRLAAQ